MNLKKGIMLLQANATVPGAVVLFAAMWVVMLAVKNGVTGAAWVQAVGSIGAILVAIWVSERSHKKARETEKAVSYAEQSRVAWICECACQEAILALQEGADGKLFRAEGITSERVLRAGETMRLMLDKAIPHRLVNPMFSGIAVIEQAWADIQSLRGSIGVADYQVWFLPHISSLEHTRVVCQTEHLRLAELAGSQAESTQRVVFK